MQDHRGIAGGGLRFRTTSPPPSSDAAPIRPDEGRRCAGAHRHGRGGQVAFPRLPREVGPERLPHRPGGSRPPRVVARGQRHGDAATRVGQRHRRRGGRGPGAHAEEERRAGGGDHGRERHHPPGAARATERHIRRLELRGPGRVEPPPTVVLPQPPKRLRAVRDERRPGRSRFEPQEQVGEAGRDEEADADVAEKVRREVAGHVIPERRIGLHASHFGMGSGEVRLGHDIHFQTDYNRFVGG